MSKLFKQEIDVNFTNYLTQARMEKAAELIYGNGTSITDIAYLVGYSDPKCFCRAFKKYFGKASSNFQRRL